MVTLKNETHSVYKHYIAEKELNDETYSTEGVVLLCKSGTFLHDNKVTQVVVVATSVIVKECFLLQFGSSFFSWHGNHSTFEQQ